ncbi:pilus assembly protein PilM [Thermodesulfobacterium hydrogeniphilum]|uniref:pilus assembly protein PilM n=1 Tax=Thermodesulfobacterium hydrogeniphilum TaxID=161156 RepID=UPI0005703102|nr:pilus assembly protein PilM [Thermodesulfobacterium hydrogeniphilum]
MLEPLLTKLKTKIKGAKKGILGINFGNFSIKIAEIKVIKDKPVLTGFIQGRSFENVILNGIINDMPLLVTNMKNILENLQSHIKNVNISLPYELIIFDFFKMKSLPQIEEIKDKINEEIPYKIEDVYYSYYILPEEDTYKIFYLVAKKDIIDQYVDLINKLDLKINNIDGDFINLHNLIEFLYGNKSKLIIDWGYSKIKLLISNNQHPIYSRELFNLGIKKLEQKIIKKLRVSPEVAEKLLIDPKKSDQFNLLKKEYINYIKEIKEEIEYSLEFVKERFRVSIETIFLVGGGARIPDIDNTMTNLLNIKTQKIKIEDKIDIDSNIDPEYLEIINSQGAIAVATAIRDFI